MYVVIGMVAVLSMSLVVRVSTTSAWTEPRPASAYATALNLQGDHRGRFPPNHKPFMCAPRWLKTRSVLTDFAEHLILEVLEDRNRVLATRGENAPPVGVEGVSLEFEDFCTL